MVVGQLKMTVHPLIPRDPPRPVDHLLLSDTIVTIIQHIFPQEEHDPDFYSRDTERAATFFTPSETGTYPDEAINHLGYPTQHP